MAISTRVLVICDDTRTLSVLVAGKFAYVNVGLLRNNHILIQSFLLCENLTDVQFYSILTKAYFGYGKYPESYVMMRPVAGGGSTLFQALHAEQAHPLKGMLICDPDTLSLVPPFKHGSTAAHAFNAAVSLNGCDCIGINDVNPMFGFFVTPGLSIENAIGPNLLEVYFRANARQTERQAILNAFPNFPNFTPEEWVLWHSLDLKNGTRTLTTQFELVKGRFGSVPASMLARSKALTLAKVPSDMFRWVVDNNSLSRWARAIEIAFRQDFANHEYETVMGPIFDGVRTLLAGDSTARRS